jgi:light-regulated signal transduction histidine kinase (bacteriophytochrome)
MHIKGMVIAMSSELTEHLDSGVVSLSARAERELTRQVSSMQVSSLARAYRLQLEARLAEHKVAALSTVARSAMSEVALIHSVEDSLIKGMQGTPVADVAVDRIDVISREFSIAAGQIMLKTAQHLSGI